MTARTEQENNNGDGQVLPDDELDFECQYSDNLPAILKELNISLAFTSYQAGRLMLIRSDGHKLDVNFKSFPRPMGLAATEDGLTLGIFTQIINFQREDGLLAQIKQPLPGIEEDITAPRIKPKQADKDIATDGGAPSAEEAPSAAKEPAEELSAKEQENREKQKQYLEKLYAPMDERVDACFITRSAHYSGMINIHDIDWGDEGLWVVNSSFSCLCTVEPDYSFVPRWKPHFISELVPEDRCHLNGMTLKDGKPAYVTTFSKFDSAGKWRKGAKFDGTLMSVADNAVLVDGLAMPHSPRWYNDRVYFCNSGLGQICSYQPDSKITQTLAEVPGFTRGMDFYGPIMFAGLSKVREADVTKPAPLAQKYDETYSGIWLFNLEDTGEDGQLKEIGHIRFTGNVDQIYDVAVIPYCSFPELIEASHPRMRNHFCHPELSPEF
ncbi:TIGR03032 family protein [Thalassomonas viridans]|uniref:TIGR03032 family protein n=1 Tax=Thalassomonas viridans TaxID=137584 RepID=A0AAE9Z4N1_9GAMM|nr:TIGR03032 family protein [Thalassomonas viridans]WDE05964.1 TIGR03032 family protein [Thalassomonas viridans]